LRHVTIHAVSLDATRTLFEPRDLASDYARVLARHGTELATAAIGGAIVDAWAEFSAASDPARDRFANEPGGSRQFWRRYLDRVCALAGAPRPSRFAAAELYDSFARPELWRVYPDVRPALEQLGAAGLRLAVVSNWDERLPLLLARLELIAGRHQPPAGSGQAIEKNEKRQNDKASQRARGDLGERQP